MNYNGLKFTPLYISENGQIDSETVFAYHQKDNVVWCTYANKRIIYGSLMGLVDSKGVIDMRYHQVDRDNNIHTGVCISTPEINSEGKIILYERWKWTSGDFSEGESKLIQI